MSESSAPAAPAAQSSAPSAESSQAPAQQAQGQAPEASQGAPAQSSAEQAVQDALDAGDTKEAKRLIEKFQLKVRGKVVDREVDLSDKEYLKNQFQLAEMSKISMQETAELKKLLNQELERLKSDPWSVLSEMGMDVDSLAESRLRSRVEEMKKSPEQLEREKYQKELQEAREEAKKLKEEKESIEMAKLNEQAIGHLNNEIDQALDAHRTLPRSPNVRRKIADSMLWAVNNGYPEVTAEDVIPLVEKELRDEMDNFMNDIPDEFLESWVGQRSVERLRKQRLGKMKQVKSVNAEVKPTTSSNSVNKQEEKAGPKLSAKDYFRTIGKR